MNRLVRFSSNADILGGSATSGSGAASQEDGTRRPSLASAFEGMGSSRRVSNASASSNSNHTSVRRLSNASNSSNRRPSDAVGPVSVAPSLTSSVKRNVNTAIAANDGPSLAAALTQSIRHHARLIDGDQQPWKQQQQAAKTTFVDPYEEDDHVSLAPGVELNYEKEAQPPAKEEINQIAPALRDYVANSGVEAADTNDRGGATFERTIEQQQERIDSRLQETSFGSRFKKNISNWFGFDTDDGMDGSRHTRSVRFAGDDDAAVASAIANGEAVPGTAFGIVGRAPKFVAPDATTFRTATRHPSHLPVGQFDNMESRLNAPRRILAARKRHRRNDTFLRILVAVCCFVLSLLFAIAYGQGQFGLAVTTMAYERKVSGQYDDDEFADRDGMVKEDVFYPEWWESQKGIPDMAKKNIQFSSTIEYHAADVTSPRAPDRIETPFFWFVPRSGGNAIRTIIAKCLRLAEASEHGAGIEASFLRIEEHDTRKFVNVDMSTSEGIKHAKSLNLASSGVADLIISPDIHGVLDIFNNRNRARIFAILRHPLDRAISKYYADLASDPEVAGMTLPQYVRSGGHRVENNYLTRYLSGRYGGRLTIHHLNTAREFLRRKFVVGLASDMTATTNLFSHVFGWNHTVASLGVENVDLCYNSILDALTDKSPPSVEEGSEGWRLLVAQNWFDLKVYEYAEHLFQLQVDQLKLISTQRVE
mmetsp:Transcript_494/g.974  ORF Transcript_494/g.974 Transcript_494/m.974 type:complete len:706 (+) Transcript_494:143-2260(+)|eukprot:CAMPEP_0183738922 /NCGR_PEP_ID=MMETSP0737-20130205/55762_1 /TAXON_ID=385413 /ORGANISM="Thalassiosira miniscula, Strain CCMP1093" /LENGTH=705 /DNA_ID=CAMNT_0025973577 /DNA_START=120 /DNA_END=2237 /DNA_ORIENTATION=+